MERLTVILTGRVGSDVIKSPDTEGGTPFARFRMVSPRGRWTDEGVWEEAPGAWYTVKAWGNLANNAHQSLRKGQPIVLVGRPGAQAWLNKENKIDSEIAIHASAIGHDLNRGISTFGKVTWDADRGAQRGDLEKAEEQDQGSEVGAGDESPAPTDAENADYETAEVSLAVTE